MQSKSRQVIARELMSYEGAWCDNSSEQLEQGNCTGPGVPNHFCNHYGNGSITLIALLMMSASAASARGREVISQMPHAMNGGTLNDTMH